MDGLLQIAARRGRIFSFRNCWCLRELQGSRRSCVNCSRTWKRRSNSGVAVCFLCRRGNPWLDASKGGSGHDRFRRRRPTRHARRRLHRSRSTGAGRRRCVFSPSARDARRYVYLDDNYGWDDGLICGGRMSILADPLTARTTADYLSLPTTPRREDGTGCTQVVAGTGDRPGTVGDRFLFDANGELIARTTKPAFLRQVPADSCSFDAAGRALPGGKAASPIACFCRALPC